MTAIIVAFGGITAAIGGLMMIPGAPLVMALGVATVGSLSLVLYTLSSAIIKLMEATKVFPKGGMEAPMNTMTTFLDAMIPMIKGIADMDMGNLFENEKEGWSYVISYKYIIQICKINSEFWRRIWKNEDCNQVMIKTEILYTTQRVLK